MPLRDSRLVAVAIDHFGRVRLDLMLAITAPHDQPHVGRSGAAERHRWAGPGSHPAKRNIGRVINHHHAMPWLGAIRTDSSVSRETHDSGAPPCID